MSDALIIRPEPHVQLTLSLRDAGKLLTLLGQTTGSHLVAVYRMLKDVETDLPTYEWTGRSSIDLGFVEK